MRDRGASPTSPLQVGRGRIRSRPMAMPPGPEADAATTSGIPDASATEVVDLDQTTAVRDALGDDYPAMLTAWDESARADLAALHAALSAGGEESRAAISAAHSLRGSALTMGARRLAEEAGRLETLPGGPPPGSDAALAALLDEALAVLRSAAEL